MLVERFKSSLGKSSHGGETLYDHTMACTRIAYKLLTDDRFSPVGYPKHKRDQMLASVFLHDIGKLDPDFQAMLCLSRDGKPLPSKRVKHEASTLDFEALIVAAQDEVQEHLYQELSYRFTQAFDLNDALAFAVSHHGLFYLSFEKRDERVVRRVRREWTVFNYGEQERITLADLLFDYHPLGGLVIIADLLGSFCHEQGIAHVDAIIGQATSLHDLIDLLLKQGIPESVEQSINLYDPRSVGLHELLILLAGGLA